MVWILPRAFGYPSLVPVDNGFSYVPVVNVGSTGVTVN